MFSFDQNIICNAILRIKKFDHTMDVYLRRASSGLADQTDQEREVFGSLICAANGKLNKMIGSRLKCSLVR